MSKEYLVKSAWDGSYSNGFSSVEVVSQETLDKLNQLKEANFSFWVHEWEGKHSEVKLTLDESDFVVVSEDPNDIIVFKRLFGNSVGNINYSGEVLERAYDRGFFDENEGDDSDE